MTLKNELSSHVIVCGLNSTSRYIIDELEKNRDFYRDIPGGYSGEYVVIDTIKSPGESFINNFPSMRYLCGDPADDTVLEKAGIRTAFGIFPVLSADKENLFITFSARQLNPSVRVVSRAADIFNIGQKMYGAGAGSVVSPNFIGGLRLVSEISRPEVTEFLDHMLRGKKPRIEEITVPEIKKQMTLDFLNIPKVTGLVVIALKKKSETEYLYNPGPKTSVSPGDTVVVIVENKEDLELIQHLSTFI
ncbi:MAG: potassium channel family protein [Fibrobacterota bacterium]